MTATLILEGPEGRCGLCPRPLTFVQSISPSASTRLPDGTLAHRRCARREAQRVAERMLLQVFPGATS